MGLLIVAYKPWREALYYTVLMTVVIKTHCSPRRRGTGNRTVSRLPTDWGWCPEITYSGGRTLVKCQRWE